MSVKASSARRGNARFTARRRDRRRRIIIASGILALLTLGGVIYLVWQPVMRISRVTIYGADQSLAVFATDAMRGSYFGLIPRDSAFFYPAGTIRARIIALHPDIAAISIFNDGTTGLSMKIDYRVPVARWCADATRLDLAASSSRSSLAASDCYLFDASGFVYATTSSIAPLNPCIVSDPLANPAAPIIGGTLKDVDRLPEVFDLARSLAAFGSPVTIVSIHDDEVDLYLASHTRITYILGSEQDALTALTSGRSDLNLSDGSLEYVDLRFPGKVYFKKAGAAAP